jgi:hypothetical protein
MANIPFFSPSFIQGILFIVVRHPFDSGDRVVVSGVSADNNCDEYLGWVVEKYDLLTTTLRSSSSNEVSTFANSSLANSQIINRARSKHAVVQLVLQFGIAFASSNEFETFKSELESFMWSRPREWLSFDGLHLSSVLTELNLVEFVLLAQHRESWQSALAIRQSKAELQRFGAELQKKMERKHITTTSRYTHSMEDSV